MRIIAFRNQTKFEKRKQPPWPSPYHSRPVRYQCRKKPPTLRILHCPTTKFPLSKWNGTHFVVFKIKIVSECPSIPPFTKLQIKTKLSLFLCFQTYFGITCLHRTLLIFFYSKKKKLNFVNHHRTLYLLYSVLNRTPTVKGLNAG